MRGFRIVPEDININIMGVRFICYALSALIMLGSIGLVATKGLNFGIDFTGGTVIEIKTPVTPDLGKLRTDLNALGLGGISIQEFGQPDDLLIRIPQQAGGVEAEKAAIQAVRDYLDAAYTGEGDESLIDYRRTEYVGPQVGEELKTQGMYAVLFSLIGILIYIWVRFEWQFGVAAIVALAHDSIATIGLFALTQMEFNLSTVAAVLMIAGYSINDTVIIFDRIRETLRKFKKMPLVDLFNLAVNNTLARTLMTSLTTLLALIALYAFGGEVIRGFVYALIFGILIGTYSSIFVASPVLLLFNIRRDALQVNEPFTEDDDDSAADAADGQKA
ncbi:MAG: protein translocase subunit SecF [Micavibrio sp.]|nr:protein translocase subunit SecF [Micavibrio sp.]|tara:strand:+ start:1690 stop:2685 length:996 start_codon:yes stop_codon:yes gene_type:complete